MIVMKSENNSENRSRKSFGSLIVVLGMKNLCKKMKGDICPNGWL